MNMHITVFKYLYIHLWKLLERNKLGVSIDVCHIRMRKQWNCNVWTRRRLRSAPLKIKGVQAENNSIEFVFTFADCSFQMSTPTSQMRNPLSRISVRCTMCSRSRPQCIPYLIWNRNGACKNIRSWPHNFSTGAKRRRPCCRIAPSPHLWSR